LPDGLGTYSTGRSLTKMEQLEMNAILEMVTTTRGNKVEMAKLLGISRSTLYRKMRYYRVDPDRSF
jgi:transcriptional regulator of acetoin/glycerol metabolism